ncbi:MAG: DNA replication/repair protein RecF [Chitinophagaceae bacterium]|nr:DNA replication/repair protein RecF [Chitinophagaceae bacterium]
MLRLSQISVFKFKNYQEASFRFTERITGIYGKNGAGKTNLLDAIHYCCFTRSYFTRTDQNNVRQGQQGFRIEGFLNYNGQPEKAVCVVRETGKKEFSVNDSAYDRFSSHIGRYPCVVIAPDDAELITGDSRERRNYLDTLISQMDPVFLQDLIRYRKLIDQRNSLLKSMSETSRPDYSLLDVIDEQLSGPGDRIFSRRRDFTKALLVQIAQLYQSISKQPEEVSLSYESSLFHQTMKEVLLAGRAKDIAAQRTLSGVHRDEIDMQLNGQAFRMIASQGQRKSLLFAMKLAELEVLQKEKGFPPLLLLDDVFEKLDEDRIMNLLRKVCVENKGQVFITDTHEERLNRHLKALGCEFQLLKL